MRAVRKHTDCPWALLYIDRWLKAPMQMADGSLIGRERGTPQGGVISPLLANLFLHYAFDLWMRRNFPDILFERYADDAICHCRDEDQATALRTALATPVQAKNGEQEGRGHGRLVQSCSQHKGAHGDPSDYPELVDASAE